MPFRFDVHALSSPAMPSRLRRSCTRLSRRNESTGSIINLRREFFYATPEEVAEVLKSIIGEVVQYTAELEAEEFRLSQGTPDVALRIREKLSDRRLNRSQRLRWGWLAELIARLGHSTPAAAMRYQHAAKDRDKAIAEALSKIARGADL